MPGVGFLHREFNAAPETKGTATMGMIPRDCKRLIEVDFPIAVVSRHAVREKSIRHGHPVHPAPMVGAAAAGVEPSGADGAAVPDPCATRSARPKFKARRAGCCRVHGRSARAVRAREDRRGSARGVVLKVIGDFANWDNAADASTSRWAGPGEGSAPGGARRRRGTRSRVAARSRSSASARVRGAASDLNPGGVPDPEGNAGRRPAPRFEPRRGTSAGG